jgi:hypothetical protein
MIIGHALDTRYLGELGPLLDGHGTTGHAPVAQWFVNIFSVLGV